MSSLFWYICLASLGVGVAIFAIYTKRYIYKTSTLFIFYLFATSITWIGEFVALGTFNGYAYKPGAFTDPWAENLFAHLLLNSSIWPGSATLMAAYSLSYGGISLITAAFILAEYLFAKLGIYEQHWWRYYMSVITVIAFLLISKKWFVKIKNARFRLSRLITCYFIALPIIHTPMPLLLLLGKQYYSLGLIENLVGNMYRSSIIFIFIYHLIENLLLVYFVCVLEKWFWKLVPYAVAIIGQCALAKMSILVFVDGWKLSYTLFIYIICISFFLLIEKFTLKPE